jgi:hypothetical protein
MPKDVIITPASGLVEFKDETVLKGSVYESSGDIYVNSVSGTIVLGDGTPADVQVGAVGQVVNLSFLGGGTISSNANSLNIGASGDTVNLNVSGVTYNWPALLVKTSDLTSALLLPIIASSFTNITASGTITGGTLVSTGNILSDSSNIVLTDISNLADGSRSVFTLKTNQTDLGLTTVVDNKDVQVVINGRTLKPYVTEATYPWIVDSLSVKGYRVRENRLIIYNAPDIGSDINITLRKTSVTKQIRRYPFSAATISLGD